MESDFTGAFDHRRPFPQNKGLPVGMTLQELEKRLIIETLEAQNQNRTKAAEILGISIRTLRNKLHEYAIIDTSSSEE